MINKLNIFIFVFFLLTSVITIGEESDSGFSSCKGITLYVGGTEAGNYSTIQDAIDNASNGDTVYVYNGIYRESILIDKKINLLGQNKSNTAIDAGNNSVALKINYDFVKVSGFRITNSVDNYEDRAIEINANNCIVSDNVIVNHSNHGTGIKLLYSSNNNVIENNFLENNLYCISHTGSSFNNLIFRNEMRNSHSCVTIGSSSHSNKIIENSMIQNEHGISVLSSTNNNITKNIIRNIEYTAIHFVSSSKNNIIRANIIDNVSTGIQTGGSSNNNLLYHNSFINNNINARDSLSNIYDNGYPIGGNYWDDNLGTDNNNDGIGDEPYDNIIDGDNQDLYPLMHPYGVISTLSSGWNFISLPVNFSTDIENVMVSYNVSFLTIQEAVNESIISPYFFGWNRTIQSYEFVYRFKPGYGCWAYVYEPCEIWFQYDSTFSESYITKLKTNWNIFSIPGHLNIEKTDLLVDNLPWPTAVSNGWVSNYVFGWDSNGQSYVFIYTFEPGQAYWMYAYQECMLKRNT